MAYPRIVVTPPGPKAREVIRLDANFASPSTGHSYPFVFESAVGCTIRDVDGNDFIDFDSAGGIMNVGHSHPRVLTAIKEQLEKAVHYGYGNAFYELLPELSKALDGIIPGRGRRFFYSNSGSEAVEAGIKAAAWHTRGQTFFGFIGSSHGRTLGALSISGANPVQKKHFPLLTKTISIPYPYCYRCPCRQDSESCDSACLSILENHLANDVSTEDVAALSLEPILGEGCIVPPEAFYTHLRKLTREHGILLLADETLTGVGRTGRWFGLDNWEMTPDILCINGSLSSGIPLGVTAAKAELMDWEPGSHTSTMGGNPLGCASALAVLDAIREEHLLENAVKRGRHLLRRLEEFRGKYPIVGDPRGKGLLVGLEVVRDSAKKEPYPEGATQIVLKSWRRGVICQTVGGSTIRFCPPLSISEELIDRGLEIVESSIHEVAEGT